jgi:hypothetical protein
LSVWSNPLHPPFSTTKIEKKEARLRAEAYEDNPCVREKTTLEYR